MKGKIIAITGCNGFLGKALAKRFSKNNVVIECTRNNCDVTNLEQVTRAFENAEIVIHCAAILDSNNPNIFKVNFGGTENVLKACVKNGVKQLIYISSVSVYGLSKGVITEGTSTVPVNNYGWSKLKAEKLVLSYKKRLGVVVFRLGWVSKEDGLFVFVRRFHRFVFNVYRFFRFNMVKRQVITVDRVFGAMESCIGNKSCFGKVFNVCEKLGFFKGQLFLSKKIEGKQDTVQY